MTTDAVRVDDGLLLDELRRATRPRANSGTPTGGGEPLQGVPEFICTMHGLPYVDGRSGCEKCLELFRTSTQSAKVESGREMAQQRGWSWSRKDTAIAADESLSNREVARLTGRTIGAVITKRHDIRAERRRKNVRDFDHASVNRAWNAIQRHEKREGDR